MERRSRLVAVAGVIAVAVVAFAVRACSRASSSARVASTSTGSAVRRSEAAARPARPSATSAEDGGRASGVMFFAPWGSAQTSLGRERPREGNPTAPMSLAPDPRGGVVVLDQVNGRLVRRGRDGAIASVAGLALRAPQDLAIAKDGSIAVLDRLSDKAIAIHDPSGALRGRIPLGGEGVPDPGLVTGVFVDGSDVYVEREHGPLVAVGNIEGVPAAVRSEIPGRPSRDGRSFLNAGIVDAAAGRVYVSSIDRASGDHRFTRELRLGARVRAIVLLDSDARGTIYFAAELHEDPADDWISLECLEPLHGAPMGSAVLPVNTMPEETFRDLAVLDEGGVVYAIRSEDGVTYKRYACGE